MFFEPFVLQISESDGFMFIMVMLLVWITEASQWDETFVAKIERNVGWPWRGHIFLYSTMPWMEVRPFQGQCFLSLFGLQILESDGFMI